MDSATKIPNTVLEAFSVLSRGAYIRRFASPVPIVPDTTFDLFETNPGELLVFVTTDYADPQIQSLELRSISGRYEFEFANLLKPHGNDSETIEILDHDDMNGDFLIKESTTYYYVANVKRS